MKVLFFHYTYYLFISHGLVSIPLSQWFGILESLLLLIGKAEKLAPLDGKSFEGAVLKTTVVVRSSLMAWLAFHCQRGCSPITVNSSTVFFHTLNAPSLYSTMALCKIIISHQFWRLQYFKLALVCSSLNNLIFASHGYLRVSRLSVSDYILHVYQQCESW